MGKKIHCRGIKASGTERRDLISGGPLSGVRLPRLKKSPRGLEREGKYLPGGKEGSKNQGREILMAKKGVRLGGETINNL